MTNSFTKRIAAYTVVLLIIALNITIADPAKASDARAPEVTILSPSHSANPLHGKDGKIEVSIKINDDAGDKGNYILQVLDARTSKLVGGVDVQKAYQIDDSGAFETSFTWDSSQYEDGTYLIKAEAIDKDGHYLSGNNISTKSKKYTVITTNNNGAIVSIGNGPTLKNGQSIRGNNFPINVTAHSTNYGFYYFRLVKEGETNPVYSVFRTMSHPFEKNVENQRIDFNPSTKGIQNLDTTAYPNGNYIMIVSAYDQNYVKQVSDANPTGDYAILVIVNNDTSQSTYSVYNEAVPQEAPDADAPITKVWIANQNSEFDSSSNPVSGKIKLNLEISDTTQNPDTNSADGIFAFYIYNSINGKVIPGSIAKTQLYNLDSTNRFNTNIDLDTNTLEDGFYTVRAESRSLPDRARTFSTDQVDKSVDYQILMVNNSNSFFPEPINVTPEPTVITTSDPEITDNVTDSSSSTLVAGENVFKNTVRKKHRSSRNNTNVVSTGSGSTVDTGTGSTIDSPSGSTTGTGSTIVDTYSISGSLWNDQNQNGVNDFFMEPKLSDWTVYIDKDNDSVQDSDESFAISNSNGEYQISNLTNGTYKVRVNHASDWVYSYPLMGSYDQTINNSNSTNVNFGYIQYSTIKGYVWNDSNSNFQFDSGTEKKLPGWLICEMNTKESKCNLGQQKNIVTDSNGSYTLTGFFPGNHKICISMVKITGPDTTEPIPGWSSIQPKNGCYEFTVSQGGQIFENKNIALYSTSMIGVNISADKAAALTTTGVSEGTEVKLSTTIIQEIPSPATYTYSWTSNQCTNSNCGNQSELTIPANTPAGTYTYTVNVIDSEGRTATKTVTVTINRVIPFAVTITADPGTTVAIWANPVKLTANVTGGTRAYRYEWEKNENCPITKESVNLEIADFPQSVSKEGTYTCKVNVTDATNSVVSATININVEKVWVTDFTHPDGNDSNLHCGSVIKGTSSKDVPVTVEIKNPATGKIHSYLTEAKNGKWEKVISMDDLQAIEVGKYDIGVKAIIDGVTVSSTPYENIGRKIGSSTSAGPKLSSYPQVFDIQEKQIIKSEKTKYACAYNIRILQLDTTNNTFVSKYEEGREPNSNTVLHISNEFEIIPNSSSWKSPLIPGLAKSNTVIWIQALVDPQISDNKLGGWTDVSMQDTSKKIYYTMDVISTLPIITVSSDKPNAINNIGVDMGTNIVLSASASNGKPAYSYAWTSSNCGTTGCGSTQSIALPSNLIPGDHKYTATVIDSRGIKNIKDVNVKILPIPDLKVEKISLTNNGTSYSIEAVIRNESQRSIPAGKNIKVLLCMNPRDIDNLKGCVKDETLTYSLEIPASGSFKWTKTYNDLNTNNTAYFWVDSTNVITESNEDNNILSRGFELLNTTVNSNPAEAIKSTGVQQGTQVLLSSSTTGGTSPYTYTWKGDLCPLAGCTGSSMTILSSTMAGYYEMILTVLDADGLKIEKNFAVIIKSDTLPVVSITADPGTTIAIWSTPVRLTANVTGGTRAYRYEWEKNENCPITKESVNLEIADFPQSVSKEGTYTCKVNVTDATNNVVSATININVEKVWVTDFTHPDGNDSNLHCGSVIKGTSSKDVPVTVEIKNPATGKIHSYLTEAKNGKWEKVISMDDLQAIEVGKYDIGVKAIIDGVTVSSTPYENIGRKIGSQTAPGPSIKNYSTTLDKSKEYNLSLNKVNFACGYGLRIFQWNNSLKNWEVKYEDGVSNTVISSSLLHQSTNFSVIDSSRNWRGSLATNLPKSNTLLWIQALVDPAPSGKENGKETGWTQSTMSSSKDPDYPYVAINVIQSPK